MNTSSLKSLRRTRSQSSNNHFSDNPIIDRFLNLTIQEGRSVRGLSLTHATGCKTVVFALDDGSASTLIADQDTGTFLSSWQEASAFVKRIRQIDLSPSF